MSFGKRIIPLLIFLITVYFASYAIADNCDKAWQWLQEAKALSDNSPREAIYLKRAMELCPDLVESQVLLGKVYLAQGELDKALREFEDAKIRILASDKLMAQPGSSALLKECMLNIGEIHRQKGELEQAANQYSRLLEMFPNYASAENRLQYILKMQHKYEAYLPPYYRIVTNPSFNRISAYPMPAGKFLFDFQFRYWHQSADITQDMFDDYVPMFYSPEERNVDVRLWLAGLRYAITDKLTVGVIGRYFWKTVHVDLGAILGADKTAKLDASGFGDTIIMVKYHLWGKRNTHLSLYTLVSLPTGDENAKGYDKDVWKEEIWHWIPLGSGSVDWTPGLAFGTTFGPLISNTNISYRFTNGKNVGDEFNLGLAFLYPFNNSVYGDLEFNYRWQGEARRKQHLLTMLGRPDYVSPQMTPAGAVPIDTWLTDEGGSTFFISPGLQFLVGGGFKLEVGAKVPVVKQDSGWAEDYVIHAGLTKRFF